MANKVVVGALVRRYAEILGHLSVVEREIEPVNGLYDMDDATDRIGDKQRAWAADLEHLQHVIRLFEPDWTPDEVKPKPPRKRVSGYGSLVRKGLAVLRMANAPMSGREIAREIFNREGKPQPPESVIRGMDNTLVASLKGYAAKGEILVSSARPVRFSVAGGHAGRAGNHTEPSNG
jgi:hypothetical protein